MRALTDVDFARAMTDAYLADLSNATEIVLNARESVRATTPTRRRPGFRPGSASRVAAGAVSLGNAAGAAMTAGRSLAKAEAKAIAHIGLTLLVLATAALIFPLIFIFPFVIVLVWMGISLLTRAWRLYHGERRRYK